MFIREREFYVDLLRIAAMVAVIFIHTSGGGEDPHTVTWFTARIYGRAASWANYVFVMISGALFLDPRKSVSIQKLYRKSIWRIVKVFCFWSAVYATCWVLFKHKTFGDWVGNFITGFYHMWFLFMIAGLYLTVPILRRVTEREDLTRYFLLLSILFTYLFPTLLEFPLPYVKSLAEARENLHFHLTLGMTGCFVGGYYLSRHDFSKRQQTALLSAGALGFILMAVNALAVTYGKMPPDGYPNLDGLIATLEAVGVFTFGRYKLSRLSLGPFGREAVLTLSKYSLCVYMVHALFLEAFAELFGLTSLSFAPIASIPILVCVVLACSLAVAFVMHRLPVLKDHVV